MWNPMYLAQVSHVLAGVSVISIAMLFSWSLGVCWWVLLGGVVLAAGKEYYFDMRFESPKDTFWDASVDFAFYALGGIIGVVIAHGAFHHGNHC
jgi:hypothetical protein